MKTFQIVLAIITLLAVLGMFGFNLWIGAGIYLLALANAIFDQHWKYPAFQRGAIDSDRFSGSMLGAKVATLIADSIAQSFFSMPQGGQGGKLSQTHSPDPDSAIKLTDAAIRIYQQQAQKVVNSGYHQLERKRAEYFVNAERAGEAKPEVETLYNDLAAREMNAPVLDNIKQLQMSL
jgi:hypothetical protein